MNIIDAIKALMANPFLYGVNAVTFARATRGGKVEIIIDEFGALYYRDVRPGYKRKLKNWFPDRSWAPTAEDLLSDKWQIKIKNKN